MFGNPEHKRNGRKVVLVAYGSEVLAADTQALCYVLLGLAALSEEGSQVIIKNELSSWPVS